MDNSLDTRQLQAFVAVSRTGSMTEAARELFLTPSAVSHVIRELEERVQCRLLDRRSKKLELTMAGEQLLADANSILSQMARTTASLEHLGKWGHDRIRIAASEAFCEHVLPGILQRFYTRYPHSHVTTEAADTLDAVELIREGKVDLAVGLQPPPPFDDEFAPLFSDKLVLCVSIRHPWAAGQLIHPRSLPTEQFLGYRRGTLLATLIDRHFRAQNIALNYSMEAGHIGFIKEAIVQNLGIGMLPHWTIKKEALDQKIATPTLEAPPLRLTWGCIWPRGRRLVLALESFINQARTFTRTIGCAEVHFDQKQG